MSELTIVAILQVKSDFINEFQQAARKVVAASQQESGCLSYRCNADINDPNTFVFVESWASKQAIEEHNKTAHFLEFKAAVENKLTERKFHLLKTI